MEFCMGENCIIPYVVLWNFISQPFLGVFEKLRKHYSGYGMNYVMSTYIKTIIWDLARYCEKIGCCY